FLQVEGLGSVAQDQVERLFLEAVETVHQPAGVRLAAEAIEAPQQGAAIFEPLELRVELHVLAGLPLRIEGSAARAEERRSIGADGIQTDVRRHSRFGMIRAA